MNTQKKLGLGSGVAICMGLIVATSCLVSLGQGFGLAGKGFIFALAIVVVLNSFIALSFSELHHVMPNATGGLGQYMLVGLGPWSSIVSNVATYVITMILASSVELAMCGMVLSELFPNIPPVVFSVVVLLILFVTNMFGIDLFSKIQNITVILLIGSMGIFGILGVLQIGAGTPIPAAEYAPPMNSFKDIIGLSAIAFWLFIGVEFIIPVAPEMKNPKKNVLRSMILALLVLFIIQSILGSGMANYVSSESLLAAEMPHITYADNLLGQPGVIWMSLITLLATTSTLNTVLPSTGKILQGMAQEKMVPAIFLKINSHKVPWAGMLLLAIFNSVLIISGFVNSNGLINMILAGSCFWLTSYIMTHINVLALRKRYPNADRDKKFMLAGIPQIIGILGCIYMIWNITDDMEDRIIIFRLFFVLLIILAAYAFLWVKIKLKKKAFQPVDIDTLRKE